MIYVDANVFLRHLTPPATPQDVASAAHASGLFEAARDAGITITTSEATVAEVIFILSAPRHYALPRPFAAAAVAQLLGLPGFVLAERDRCIHALGLWVSIPALSFPDALAAASSQLDGHDLATFDRALAKTPGVKPYAW